jgi:ABC-type branched-subunit amino acid transport system substrate-binding protein
MAHRYLSSLTLASLVVALLACSVTDQGARTRRPMGKNSQDISPVSPTEPMPWEIWQPFFDSDGNRLSNASLLLGDEFLAKGKRRSALEAYQKAHQLKLTDSQGEAAALRVASQYLALDESARSLATISSFFKSRGLGEDEVSLNFSLLLAYAYGRHGDAEQSLAWFSKANRQAQRGERIGIGASESGAVLFLRTIPDSEFENVALDWTSDPFINQLFGRERFRRASPGYGKSVGVRRPFWEASGDALVATDITPKAPSGGSLNGAPVVGLLLSLSDRFGSLGRETKQGFDLAIEADKSGPPIRVDARDVGTDTAAASAAVRELVATSTPAVIVGPLLTEASVSASETARDLRVPLLSFSKSESFQTGNGISRLGATTTSQIDALVTAAYKDFNISQFAIAYPESANGNEVLHVFKKKLAVLGMTPILEAPYTPTDEASVLEAAQRLESSGAQAVLIPDTIEVSVKLLSNVSNATRRKMRPLGTALWDNPQKVANSQALFERAVFVTPFFPQSMRSVVQKFTESYKARYNVAPNFLAAQGFDAGTLVAAGIRKSQRENSSFSEAFSKLPRYEGVTGPIAVQGDGTIQRGFYVVEVTPTGMLERFPGSGGVTDPAPASESATTVRTAPSFLKDDERVESGY